MPTILLMRPGTAVLMLYTSGSRILSAFRYGDPGGNSVTTTPPGRIGWGAYGASVAGPGFGTLSGAGGGGSFGRSCAIRVKTAAAPSRTVLVNRRVLMD